MIWLALFGHEQRTTLIVIIDDHLVHTLVCFVVNLLDVVWAITSSTPGISMSRDERVNLGRPLAFTSIKAETHEHPSTRPTLIRQLERIQHVNISICDSNHLVSHRDGGSSGNEAAT